VLVPGKPFQLWQLLVSKGGAYPSEECPISQLHLGMDKLLKVSVKVIKKIFIIDKRAK
jgi:hypothetical protein